MLQQLYSRHEHFVDTKENSYVKNRQWTSETVKNRVASVKWKREVHSAT